MGKIAVLFVILAVLLSGCSSHRFVPIGMASSAISAKPENCGAKILLHAPSGVEYEEIGICYGQTPGGGMISDKTPEAIIELQKCACVHGGDAILLGGTGDAGVMPAFGGYSQQVAKAQGVVIVFK